jgi:hypothetical protein
MPVSSHAGNFGGRAAAASAARAKAARLLFALACCALLTACPPDGGDLVPLASREGQERVTNKFAGDTLRLSQRGVTMQARGRWSVADGATSVILEISNANAESLSMDFSRCEVLTDGGERLTLRSAREERGAGATPFLQDNVAVIGGGQRATFALEFKVVADGGRAGVPREMLGRTLTLRLPVESKAEPPARLDFVFDFKCAEYQRRT